MLYECYLYITALATLKPQAGITAGSYPAPAAQQPVSYSMHSTQISQPAITIQANLSKSFIFVTIYICELCLSLPSIWI